MATKHFAANWTGYNSAGDAAPQLHKGDIYLNNRFGVLRFPYSINEILGSNANKFSQIINFPKSITLSVAAESTTMPNNGQWYVGFSPRVVAHMNQYNDQSFVAYVKTSLNAYNSGSGYVLRTHMFLDPLFNKDVVYNDNMSYTNPETGQIEIATPNSKPIYLYIRNTGISSESYRFKDSGYSEINKINVEQTESPESFVWVRNNGEWNQGLARVYHSTEEHPWELCNVWRYNGNTSKWELIGGK